MKICIKGGAEVSLTKADFVAEGGEGQVYARGPVGYKIYHDASKAIPLGKIQELSGITDPNVIKPQDPIYKGPNTGHIGHTFRFVRDTWTLCQLFPRAFREREGFSHDAAIKLVQKIQNGVTAVHASGSLIVDLNEMNFLVSRDFSTPYFIDVDSYQTRHYPATAIMPSVRDPKVQTLDFTTLSDWFSFAIVSFQIFVGIHPFKGKHPTVHGLEDRMKLGISVFDRKVNVPKAAYSFDCIPNAYRAWYQALFVDGKRVLPPTELNPTIHLQSSVQRIDGVGNFVIAKILECQESIRFSVCNSAGLIIRAGSDWHFGQYKKTFNVAATAVVGCATVGRPVIAALFNGGIKIYDLTGEDGQINQTDIRADEIMSYRDSIYFRNRDKVFELLFTKAGNKTIVSSRLAANVLEHASRLYEGVAIQNLLGEPHISIFARSGACYQIKLNELKGSRVVDAKFDSGVLMILVVEKGVYHRWVFRFDENYQSYDPRKVEDVQQTGLNFVTLDTGVCVCLNEEDQLEIFSSKKGSPSMKIIKDNVLGGDMRLTKDHGKLHFFRDNELYAMSMKQ